MLSFGDYKVHVSPNVAASELYRASPHLPSLESRELSL